MVRTVRLRPWRVSAGVGGQSRGSIEAEQVDIDLHVLDHVGAHPDPRAQVRGGEQAPDAQEPAAPERQHERDALHDAVSAGDLLARELAIGRRATTGSRARGPY
jgi:hypothetical protein